VKYLRFPVRFVAQPCTLAAKCGHPGKTMRKAHHVPEQIVPMPTVQIRRRNGAFVASQHSGEAIRAPASARVAVVLAMRPNMVTEASPAWNALNRLLDWNQSAIPAFCSTPIAHGRVSAYLES